MRKREQKKLMLIGLGASSILIGCVGNLSHNDSKQTPAFELIRESEAEALASEITNERELTKETTVPATEPRKYMSSLAEYQRTYETYAETTIVEPTTVETTTTEEVTTELTEAVTEPYIEPTTYAVEYDDATLLVKLASCEAGGQGTIGMALVMRTVLNRCEITGASIHDVIYCPGQYSVVGCDDWNNNYIVAESYEALALVQSGWDESYGALYFCTPAHNSWHQSALTYLFTYGGHEYYK